MIITREKLTATKTGKFIGIAESVDFLNRGKTTWSPQTIGAPSQKPPFVQSGNGNRMSANVRPLKHKRRTHEMQQLKIPIIGVLAASVLVLSNPPPANATQSFDYRSILIERVRDNRLNDFTGIHSESGKGFLDLFSHQKSVSAGVRNGWSSGDWHGNTGASQLSPREVIVPTPEPLSLLDLATVSLMSAGLWFWRRKPAVIPSSPLSTV